jgi:hypothetical protein
MIEIPTPYTVETPEGQTVINPAVLEAQRANYYHQRQAYENGKLVGMYNLDGTVKRFSHESNSRKESSWNTTARGEQ